MSNGALFTSMVALRSQNTKIGTIAENMANLRTNGFKRVETRFSDFLGSIDKANFPTVPVGVKPVVTRRIGEAGPTRITSSPLDVALTGRGYMVGNQNPDGSGDAIFRKDGSFKKTSIDGRTFITSHSGTFLMGWKADSDGNVTPGQSLSGLEPVKYNPASVISPAVQSTKLQFRDILPASPVDGQKLSNTITVYDNFGGSKDFTIEWQKDPTKLRAWTATFKSDDTTPQTMGSVEVVFNEAGKIEGELKTSITPQWSDGTPSVPLEVDLSEMLQISDGTTLQVRNTQNNGRPAGSITDVRFNDKGYLVGLFSNGMVQNLYKIPFVTFNNPDGLTMLNQDNFSVSQSSGQPRLHDPENSTLGEFTPGRIEMSNVKINDEFANLIFAQKAYSSAGTSLRVATEMLETARDLI